MDKNGKFEQGDLVIHEGKIMYYVGEWGRNKSGDGPYRDMILLCPLRKESNLPDLRIWNSRAFKFRYQFYLDEVRLYRDRNGDYQTTKEDGKR
jgi:hypothetical protein